MNWTFPTEIVREGEKKRNRERVQTIHSTIDGAFVGLYSVPQYYNKTVAVGSVCLFEC